jgi:hypothetical protein
MIVIGQRESLIKCAYAYFSFKEALINQLQWC